MTWKNSTDRIVIACFDGMSLVIGVQNARFWSEGATRPGGNSGRADVRSCSVWLTGDADRGRQLRVDRVRPLNGQQVPGFAELAGRD